jgi:hypothetical protein
MRASVLLVETAVKIASKKSLQYVINFHHLLYNTYRFVY